MAKQFVTKILCLSFCLSFSACGSSYPADTGGGTVSGTIFYQGDTHKNIDNVGLAINAFAAGADYGNDLPHASLLIIDPEFSAEGFAYQLKGLAPFEYLLMAVIFDLDQEASLDVLPETIGAYPDFCSFIFSPTFFTVTDDQSVSNIDVILYDSMGFDDPCF